MAMASERYASSPLTDAIVGYIGHYQRHDGTWWSGGVSRAPLEEGTMSRTAMAIRAMQVFGTPAMKADLDLRIARARTYLANAKRLPTTRRRCRFWDSSGRAGCGHGEFAGQGLDGRAAP